MKCSEAIVLPWFAEQHMRVGQRQLSKDCISEQDEVCPEAFLFMLLPQHITYPNMCSLTWRVGGKEGGEGSTSC